MTLQQIAKITGLSVERVRQIEKVALRKMRAAMGVSGPDLLNARSRNVGRKSTPVVDHLGEKFESVASAAYAHAISAAEASRRLKSGEWRRA